MAFVGSAEELFTSFVEHCQSCRRTFTRPGALSTHQKTCRATKSHLSAALALAKRARDVKNAARVSALQAGITGEVYSEETHRGIATASASPTSAQGEEDRVRHDGPGPKKRRRKLPPRYRSSVLHDPELQNILPPCELEVLPDVLPEPVPAVVNFQQQMMVSTPEIVVDPAPPFATQVNAFGLFRRYDQTPTACDPEDKSATLKGVSESSSHPPSLAPYPNESALLIGDWFWNTGPQKSQKDFKKLISIISSETFSPADIRATNWRKINKQLAINDWDSAEWMDEDAGWFKENVTIQVPFQRNMKNPGVQPYTVANFYRRSLTAIIEEKLKSSHNMRYYHYEPYELLWQRSPDSTVRLHGELYTSPKFLAAHRELQNAPREPGCTLPRCVVALMFWSDATHLTAFGDEHLWPLYMGFGNDSKYERCKPTNNIFEHVAYFVELPPEFENLVAENSGKDRKFPDRLLTHCNQELAQEQWMVLLDDNFIHAYNHGIVVEGPDGITRRHYPRILTYSADYEEKSLMATIRQNGLYPCPRCRMPKTQFPLFGTQDDREQRSNLARTGNSDYQELVTLARDTMYNDGNGIDSVHVERKLKPLSLVPTVNAFSRRLGEFLNFFFLFVVDLMHEVESGTWKAALIHLLRILQSFDEHLLYELDKRFREIPTFGQGTIRRFSTNTSELKNTAAWYFEDVLQCAIPAFEGLLPEPSNTQILQLLFQFGHWHGLAKLRLHSDPSIDLLDRQTSILGDEIRKFEAETCAEFETRELQREQAARKRREAREDKKSAHALSKRAPRGGTNPVQVNSAVAYDPANAPVSTASTAAISHEKANGEGQRVEREAEKDRRHSEIVTEKPKDAAANPGGEQSETTKKPKDTAGPKIIKFNMNTYKHHALGDYADTIRQYGTTDAYSTELGELEHRNPKAKYKRTSKKGFQKQLAQMERRQARVRRIRESIVPEKAEHLAFDEESVEPLSEDPSEHHHIGRTEKYPVHIGTFLRTHSGDPATKDFFQQLKQHVSARLKRILEAECEPGSPELSAPSLPDLDMDMIYFNKDLMYKHKIMRVNYTAYDVRRAQDAINPGTDHRDIMLLSRATSHEYDYARVLGIYHINVIYGGAIRGKRDYTSRRMEFLWVRWFETKSGSVEDGWSNAKLDELRFRRLNDQGAFGFIDPRQVLRACHIIPRFSLGKLHEDGRGLSESAQDCKDWRAYYANRFVDRDMLMRYHWGLGVGHLYARQDGSNNGDSDRNIARTVDPGSHVSTSSGEQPEGEAIIVVGPPAVRTRSLSFIHMPTIPASTSNAEWDPSLLDESDDFEWDPSLFHDSSFDSSESEDSSNGSDLPAEELELDDTYGEVFDQPNFSYD